MGQDQGDQALSVLRGIWTANRHTADDLDGVLGNAKVCKNTANLGLHDVDDDLRAAWRAKLEREGKLHPQGESVRDLVRRTTQHAE
jgi:hypothetical protein